MTSIHPTRRGWTVIGISLSLLVLGTVLNTARVFALVVPFAVIGLLAYWQVFRLPTPTVSRRGVVDSRAGTTRTVRLEVDGVDSLLGSIHDRVGGDGVAIEGDSTQPLNGPGTYTYNLSYHNRGAYEIGPTLLTLTDTLGLFRRSETVGKPASVLVYPPIVKLPGQLKQTLTTTDGDTDPLGRTEFDRLREYDRSDALRDIDWKASAKQPDETFIVKEFIGAQRRGVDAITIGIDAETPAETDTAAAAAASIAAYLLRQDVPVGLQTTTREVPPETGVKQRRAIDERLSRLESPSSGESTETDVTVRSDGQTVTVGVFGEHHTVGTTPTAHQVSHS